MIPNYNHTRKRGGPQPGSGRPGKPPEEKFRRAQITMTPEQFTATAKDRSGMVRRALEFETRYRLIVEAVIRAAFNSGLSLESPMPMDNEWRIILTTRNHELVLNVKEAANEIQTKIPRNTQT